MEKSKIDYNNSLIRNLIICLNSPQKDMCKACSYYSKNDKKCSYKLSQDVANTIQNLISRAEKAERDLDRYKSSGLEPCDYSILKDSIESIEDAKINFEEAIDALKKINEGEL